MRSIWKRAFNRFDQQLALAHLALGPERPALLIFMFHVLFEDKAAIARQLVDPQQHITTQIFAEFIAYYQARGYAFVAPADVLRGLDPMGKYVLITFDDGYYNNHLALPILRRYGVSATFFISTYHVQANRAFWWDVVYRERQRQPLSATAQEAEYALLKGLRHEEVEEYLLANFGAEALQPVGDLDRPFTPAELRAFAHEPEVVLGNHTAHHAVLTNYAPPAAAQELAECQRYLGQLTGSEPVAVAYPNGNCSPAVVAAAAQAGLHLGVTVQAGKNYLPLASAQDNILQLKRFLLWGNQDVQAQCTLFRTDFHLKQLLRPTRA
jgi:peptidoglycan/xylan/chitin deacetylase (PgdA/CDA1 family)